MMSDLLHCSLRHCFVDYCMSLDLLENSRLLSSVSVTCQKTGTSHFDIHQTCKHAECSYIQYLIFNVQCQTSLNNCQLGVTVPRMFVIWNSVNHK